LSDKLGEIKAKVDSLEERVKGIKDRKKAYEEGEQRWGRERAELAKQLEASTALKSALLALLGGATAPAPQTGVQEMHLDYEETAVTIAHSERVVKMTTGTVAGQILYCALVELPREGFAGADLPKALEEHGWNVGQNTLAPTLGKLVKDGSLIRFKENATTKYRLPQKVKLNVEKV
jgi:hypothetical protein